MSALPNFKTELPALQSIAANDGSMSAHAGQASQATAALKTPRKQVQIVPVLDPAIGVAAIRDRYQKDACKGNARAAKLLQLLAFRYLAKEDGTPRLETYRYGNHWWERTHADWAQELGGISVDQVRTDINKLVTLGHVVARPLKVFNKGKNAGKTVLHMRLVIAGGAASLNGWPDYSQIGIVLGWDFSHPLENGIFPIHKDLKEETLKEEEKPNTNPVAEKQATGDAHALMLSGKGVNVKSKTPSQPPTPGSASPPSQPAPDQFDEQYLKIVPVPTMPPVPGGKRPAKSVRAWFDGMARNYPSAGSDLGRENCRRLVNLGNKVYAAVQDRDGFIDFFTTPDRWLDFRYNRAIVFNGAHKGKLGDMPNIKDLEAHLPAAIEFYVAKTAPKPVHAPHPVYAAPALNRLRKYFLWKSPESSFQTL